MSEDTTPTVETPAQTPEKATSRQMTFTILDDGSIQPSFGPGLENLTLLREEFHQNTIEAAISAGMVSRLRAFTSRCTGDERTPENLRAAVALGIESLKKGEWATERAPAALETTIEVEAAWGFRKARAAAEGREFTETLAETAVAWAALTDEQQKKVKALPRYAAILAAVKAERAAAKAAKAQKAAEKAAQEDEALF
jgi:hypothetical protein